MLRTNRPRSKKDELHANTKGLQLYNQEGFSPSTLICGYWNTLVDLKMHPVLDSSRRTDKSVYDYDTFVNVILSLSNLVTLRDIVKDKILPAIEKGEDVDLCFSPTSTSLLRIATGMQKKERTTFLGIYRELDNNGGLLSNPKSSLHFEFTGDEVFTSYDPNNGKYKSSTKVNKDLLAFLEFLNGAIAGLTMASAHASKYDDRYVREANKNTMIRLSESLGGGKPKAPVAGGVAPSFSSSGSSYTSADETPVEEVETLDDYM